MLKKILFISHDASLTGAPVVLLNLLRWLKKNTDLKFDILLLKDGPLKKEFQEISETYYVPFKYKYNFLNKIRRRIYPHLSEKYKISELVTKFLKNSYSVIFGNTIVSLPLLLQFKNSGKVKVVCAIHELSYIIEYHFTKEYVLRELPNLDFIIAGSQAVKDNLQKEFKISQECITVIHAFIYTNFNLTKSRKTLKLELGIKEDELIIGGMGSFDLRKGTDLIIPLVMELKSKYPKILFRMVWVGGLEADISVKLFKNDVEKCELQEYIIFKENTSIPNEYINLYDIFVLLSREDPFPLVLLNAAAMGKAAIAFDKSGGAPELLNNDAGFLAPYLNIEVFAQIISTLYYDRNLIKETGKKAKEKVEKEFSDGVIPARVLKFLREL